VFIAIAEDFAVSRFVAVVLKRHGYQSVISDAPRLLNSIETVDLVITNHPLEFAGVAGKVLLIYLSGAPDPAIAAQFPMLRTVRKPFQSGELIEAIEELTWASTSG
jgi:hypothetical protein